ncbi:hypothetical protein [Candidatus Poriferisodalis sp.]|uniref:hypothetical protein n=1 Tax=Candidatus Poriferisodalis sp. TaxID=3101277 RepID=UPI003B02BFD0
MTDKLKSNDEITIDESKRDASGVPLKRNAKGQFVKGSGGRPVGSKNKSTVEIREACQGKGKKLVKLLMRIAQDHGCVGQVRAIELLLAYGYGKPVQQVAATVDVSSDVRSLREEVMAITGAVVNDPDDMEAAN